MRRFVKTALVTMAAVIAGFAALAFWALRHSYPPQPALTGEVVRGAFEHGGRARSWIAYLPAKRAAAPALVIVLHSSMGSGRQAREAFGYDFDLLADQHGFIVVYPNGVEGHWNEARIAGPFAAKRDNVDDVGFVRALVDNFVANHDVDRGQVYTAGYSNGGSMALRLALEAPEIARAYGVVLANMPAPNNLAASPRQQAVSILFMNGTEDPLNPWTGGDVVLHGVWGNRGPVLSTRESVEYFRTLAGIEDRPAVLSLPDRDVTDGSTVERSTWAAPGRPHIALYAINGGGHEVPHPQTYGRRLLGRSNRDVHAAREIWEFFMSVS